MALPRARMRAQVWRHDDSGILKYTDVDALVQGVQAARGVRAQAG
jgi:hypothetical protein